MEQESEQTSTRAQLWALTTLCWPLVVAMTLALLISREQPAPSALDQPAQAAAASAQQERGKLLLVIVDGLRQQALDDHMPRTKQLGHDADAWERPLHTCSGNFTVPCVQTILEGRQSPFAAGLENFTGKPGGAQSVPAIMARAGLNLAMISDFTLDTLYGDLAKVSINVEQWPGDYLDHDLETIKQAHKWLDEGGYDALLVHVVGTDKVAHRQRPGHPKYAEHYATVDEALDGLYKRLDYSKDHLIVVGDHGHDQKGHHTRDSVVIVKGPRLGGLMSSPAHVQALEPLEQPELAYLLSLAAQVPLSSEYEGRLLGLEPAAAHPEAPELDRALEHMAQLEIETLKAQGLEGETLLELRQAQLKQRAAQPWLALMRHSPLLILYLSWVMGIAAIERGLKWRPRHLTVGAGLGAVFLWFMGSWLPPLAAGVMALLMLAALVLACACGPLKHARRMYSLWLVPLMLIVIISLLGARWSELLHSRGGVSAPMVLFFLALVGAGALISRVHSGQWTRSMPEAIGALCVIGLPSGVYYYQLGQNLTRGFAIGGVVMLLALGLRRRLDLKALKAQAYALVVFGVGLGLTLWQSAGGWEWHAGIACALKRAHVGWPILIYAGMGLAILGLLKRWRARAVIGALWVLTPLYAVGVGQLKWPMLVSGSAAALTMAGWLALTGERWRAHARQDTSQDQREGLWLFGLWMMGCWALFSGFFIGQVDFNFAFEFLSMLTLERDVAIGASIMTMLKYSLPLWPMALLLGAWRPGRSHALTKWLMLALHIKIIALLIQLLCGPLFSTQKLYELALSELLFVFSLGIIILSGSALALWLEPMLQGSRPKASA